MPYLVDSDVLIDISRGNGQAIDYVDSLSTGWAISQFTAMELIVGARDSRELAKLDKFLSAFVIVPVYELIGTKAYSLVKAYARSHGLQVFDALIAATAIEEELTLVTRNQKHFRMIDELNLLVPDY